MWSGSLLFPQKWVPFRFGEVPLQRVHCRYCVVRAASTRAPQGREYIFGVHSCASALQANGRKIFRVYVARRVPGTNGDFSAVDGVVSAAAASGVPVTWTDRQHVHNLAQQPTPIVMDASEIVPCRVDDALELQLNDERESNVSGTSSHALVVALDEVQDPHNVGAIVRSALLLGADWVVASVKNAAPFNSTVSRTSVGALEYFAGARRLGSTESMPSLLADCRAHGWRVLGAAAPPSAQSVTCNTTLSQKATAELSTTQVPWIPVSSLRRDVPTILVLGNEGRGLRTNVARSCTAFAYIPMDQYASGRRSLGMLRGKTLSNADLPLLVDSLNVSAAAAILLYHLGGRGAVNQSLAWSRPTSTKQQHYERRRYSDFQFAVRNEGVVALQRMASSFLHVLCAGSLLLQAYRTAKHLKVHVDVVVDRIEDAAEVAIDTNARSAASATPSSLRSRRRRATMTPQDVVDVSRRNDEAASRMLCFWVLIGLLSALEALRLPYAFSARVLLTLVIGSPWIPDRWLMAMFNHIARPVLGHYATHVLAASRWGVRRCGAAIAPTLRLVVAASISKQALGVVSREELLLLRDALSLARTSVTMEARRRTRASLTLPASFHSGSDAATANTVPSTSLVSIVPPASIFVARARSDADPAPHTRANGVTDVAPLPMSDDDSDSDSASDGVSNDVDRGPVEPTRDSSRAVNPSSPRSGAASLKAARRVDAIDPWNAPGGMPIGDSQFDETAWLAPLPDRLQRRISRGVSSGFKFQVFSPMPPPAPPVNRSVSAPRAARRRTSPGPLLGRSVMFR